MKKTITFLLTTTMFLALIGCGAAASESSSENISSGAEVDTTSDSDAGSETSTAIADDAASDSSSSASSTSTTASSDDYIEYKGKTISFSDDIETTLDTLNSIFPDNAHIIEPIGASGLNIYSYDINANNEILFDIITFSSGGKQLPGQIDISESNYKTTKGISIGTSSDDVIAAYGKPTEIKGNNYALCYKLENFNLRFDLDNGKVDTIVYLNPDFPNQ